MTGKNRNENEIETNKIEKGAENFTNSLLTKVFAAVLGVVLTSLITLNCWIVSELYSHDKRISLLEENKILMMEFKSDIKEIKSDVNDLKLKVEVMNNKLEK